MIAILPWARFSTLRRLTGKVPRARINFGGLCVYQGLAVDRQPLQANEVGAKEFLRDNCVQS